MTTNWTDLWKPDFNKADPWEGVPKDYGGYVPTSRSTPERSSTLRFKDELYEEDVRRLNRGEKALHTIFVGSYMVTPDGEVRFPTLEEVKRLKEGKACTQ